MSFRNIIREWKDSEYRLSLSDAERAPLPAHLAGLIELADAELSAAAGGAEHDGQGCNTHSAHSPTAEPEPNWGAMDRYADVGRRESTYEEVECSSTNDAGCPDVDYCTQDDYD